MGDLKTLHLDPANAEQARAWDGDEGDYWAAHAERFDEAVAEYHAGLMDAARIEADFDVLDIGCGTGQTTRDAASRAKSGHALGVDLSHKMLELARRLAEREGLHNVTFEQADAQVHPFRAGSFDVAISRTGTMFFGDPVAAFTNIGRALRPGGRLAMVAWQPISENEWFREIVTAFAAGRDLPPPPPESPNPFSLSVPDRVRQLLTTAGFEDPVFEDLHAPMYFGGTADDAHRLVLGLQGWMLEGLDDTGRQRALDDLHASMEEHETERGVEFSSAMWLITATQRA
jgi:SAM-dependent methyltransferase